MGVGQLFRELRDETVSNKRKVAKARQGWESTELRFPKKSDFFVQWVTERLLKTKAQQDVDAPILITDFWSFLNALLELTPVTAIKVPFLPVVVSLLEFLAARPMDIDLINHAQAVLVKVLPVFFETNLDQTVQCLQRSFDAQTGKQNPSAAALLLQVQQCAVATLAEAPPATQKRANLVVLGQLDQIQQIAAASPSFAHESLKSACSLLFCASAMRRLLAAPSLSDSDLLTALQKLSASQLSMVLPDLFGSFLSSADIEAKGTDGQPVPEHVSFSKLQTVAFSFVDAVSSTKADQDTLAGLLQHIVERNLYSSGAPSATAVLAKIANRAAANAVGLFGILATLNLVVVQPLLPNILASLNPTDPSSSAFLDILRPLFVKNRALPAFLELLYGCPSIPTSEKTAIAKELALEEPLGLKILTSACGRISEGDTLPSELADLVCLIVENAQPAYADKPQASSLLRKSLKALDVPAALDGGRPRSLLQVFCALQARLIDLQDELDEESEPTLDDSTVKRLSLLVKKTEDGAELEAAARVLLQHISVFAPNDSSEALGSIARRFVKSKDPKLRAVLGSLLLSHASLLQASDEKAIKALVTWVRQDAVLVQEYLPSLEANPVLMAALSDWQEPSLREAASLLDVLPASFFASPTFLQRIRSILANQSSPEDSRAGLQIWEKVYSSKAFQNHVLSWESLILLVNLVSSVAGSDASLSRDLFGRMLKSLLEQDELNLDALTGLFERLSKSLKTFSIFIPPLLDCTTALQLSALSEASQKKLSKFTKKCIDALEPAADEAGFELAAHLIRFQSWLKVDPSLTLSDLTDKAARLLSSAEPLSREATSSALHLLGTRYALLGDDAELRKGFLATFSALVMHRASIDRVNGITEPVLALARVLTLEERAAWLSLVTDVLVSNTSGTGALGLATLLLQAKYEGDSLGSSISLTLRACYRAVPADPAGVAGYLHSVVSTHNHTITHHDIAVILTLIFNLFNEVGGPTSTNAAVIYRDAIDSLVILVRSRQESIMSLFVPTTQCLSSCFHLLRLVGQPAHPKLPAWAAQLDATAAALTTRLMIALTSKSFSNHGQKSTSYHGALSKHAPFVLARYLLACTATPPLSSSTRAVLWPGIKAVMGCMSKYEREALMKGLLASEHESERTVLRSLWKEHDRQRYKGA